MPKVDIWYPFYPRDYDAATKHLTDAEDLAYRRLIDHYWCNGGPFPDDDQRIALVVRKSSREWAQMRKAVAPFFRIVGDAWTHKRIDAEIAKAITRSEKAARAAAVKWRGHAPKTDAPRNAPSIAQASPKHMLDACPSPSPCRDKPIEGLSPTGGETPILPFERQSAAASPGEPRLTREELAAGVAEIREILAKPKDLSARALPTRAAASGRG